MTIRIQTDIPAKVAEGISGVKEVLTEIESALGGSAASIENLSPKTRLAGKNYSSYWAFHFSSPNGETHSNIVDRVTVPEYAGIKSITLGSAKAKATGDSVVAGSPTLRFYKNGTTLGTITASTTLNQTASAALTTTLKPGDTLSWSVDTSSGADVFAPICVMIDIVLRSRKAPLQ